MAIMPAPPEGCLITRAHTNAYGQVHDMKDNTLAQVHDEGSLYRGLPCMHRLCQPEPGGRCP